MQGIVDMNLFDTLTLLMGAPDASGAAADPNAQLVTTIVTFGLVFVVFYFLIIRPQNKKQKEAKKMMESLKKGDKVQTIGGLRGTVWQVNEKADCVIIKTEEDVKLEFVRSAIASVLEQKPADAAEKADAKSEKTDENKE
jgi:preprotein translocase subunit YajC